MKYLKAFIPFIILSLIILEIYFAHLSYENYGWTMPIFIYFLIILNIIPIVSLFFKKYVFAVVSFLIIAFAIIPNQLYLNNKHIKLKEEGANIVNYVYQEKLNNGSFPNDLNDYKFKFIELMNDIDYELEKNGSDFLVIYSVGTLNTSHYFRHSYGYHWMYYDD